MTTQADTTIAGSGPERRQATIVFCDLVGSTELAVALDPEDMRNVLKAFRSTAGAAVAKHEGVIAQYLGDGMLLFFGYPHAYEDAPERAARAALEIVESVAGLKPMPGVDLRIRVGIATGLVVIGDVLGDGAAREQAVAGSTTHLAARIQSLAQPGQVLISDSTRSLLGDLFDCEDLGRHEMKGFSEPQRMWRVLAERFTLSRFGAVRMRRGLSPLVGRDPEMALVRDRWSLATAGAGQMVELRGEAGIGKSRLAEAFIDSLADEPHWLLRYSCTPHTRNTALFPVISQIEFAAGFARGDSPATRIEKLEKLVTESPFPGDSRQAMPYLATLLSIPLEGSAYAPPADTPEWLREKTLEILRAWPLALAADQPVVILLEDLHWADPTTLDLMNHMLVALGSHRVLLLATARPDFDAPWPASPGTVTATLARLDRDSRVTIVQHYTGGHQLPDEVLVQILDKSDGIPLFVEEITHAVLESDILEPSDDGALQLRSSPGAMSVPSSLQDLLMARLDRLARAKEVAQIASVIGREFSRDLLSEVTGLTEDELDGAIARLDAADLLHPVQETAVQRRYRFRHALIQEAAYGCLLRSTRQSLHRKIAATLEARFPETLDQAPELLAHHFTEAGDPSRSLPYWKQAGLRAASRAANAEASRHFQSALTQLDQLPNDMSRSGAELELQVQLGLALSAWRGYAAPGVETAYRRARELCQLMGDVAELFPVIRGLSTFYIVRAQFDSAHELALQCVRLGEETTRPDCLIEGYTALGYVSFYFGHIEKAVTLLSRAIEIYRTAGGETLHYPSAQDPCVASLCLLSHALCLQGKLVEARRTAAEALELVERLGRPFETAYARGYCAMLENLLGNPQLALDHAQQCLAISQERGFMIWLGVGTIQLACAMTAMGDAAGASEMLENTFAAWVAGGAELSTPFCKAWIARNRLALGRIDAALAAVDEGLAASRVSGERYMDADLLRVRAEILHARGEEEESLRSLRNALDVATDQGACLFALWAATELFRHTGDGTNRKLLEDALAPLAGLAEVCPDVVGASAALAQVAVT
ncbi:MAG: AAA family ATPase [Betaproteobacteria bacterium]|nr:AAA family ATPase [Betaproteobacteria bacterium]